MIHNMYTCYNSKSIKKLRLIKESCVIAINVEHVLLIIYSSSKL